jgi:hypothetical protein
MKKSLALKIPLRMQKISNRKVTVAAIMAATIQNPIILVYLAKRATYTGLAELFTHIKILGISDPPPRSFFVGL